MSTIDHLGTIYDIVSCETNVEIDLLYFIIKNIQYNIYLNFKFSDFYEKKYLVFIIHYTVYHIIRSKNDILLKS